MKVALVDLTGDAPGEELRAVLLDLVEDQLPTGEPFREEAFEELEASLASALQNRGYAWAEVKRSADVDLVEHRALVRYAVTMGPRTTFGDVTLEGLDGLPDEEVRNTLDIEPGATFSAAELERAHQRALDLGVFSSVRIEPQLGDEIPETARPVPIAVQVKPSQLRTVRLGGGLSSDALKTDVHLRAGWEDRNFFGGLRQFSVDFRPAIVLHPLRINNWVAPTRPLPAGRLGFRLEQPDFLEAHTVGYLAPEANISPVLLRTNPDEDDPVFSYLETGILAGATRTWWNERVRVRVEKNLRYAHPFSIYGELDPLLGDLFLGYPRVTVDLDLRDDRLRPHAGIFLSQAIESLLFVDAMDLKLVPELRGYIPLGPDVTFAARARVGLLFPFDYADTIESQLNADVAGRDREEVRDLQLLYFRGFFGGGPNSNRGYPLRTIGPHAVVPFLSLGGNRSALTGRCARVDQVEACGSPIGGLTLWELSFALRFPLADPLSAATFCDMADVAPGRLEIRPDHPHLSCGFGARYDTPVGPIRLDLAYRIPGAQVPSDQDPRIEGDPGTIFGAPINVSVGIGEGF